MTRWPFASPAQRRLPLDCPPAKGSPNNRESTVGKASPGVRSETREGKTTFLAHPETPLRPIEKRPRRRRRQRVAPRRSDANFSAMEGRNCRPKCTADKGSRLCIAEALGALRGELEAAVVSRATLRSRCPVALFSLFFFLYCYTLGLPFTQHLPKL